jgi:hypothetical protein
MKQARFAGAMASDHGRVLTRFEGRSMVVVNADVSAELALMTGEKAKRVLGH